ncbi:hypothetical protein B0H12DRAFT_1079739 [Mycena haematopus]|nr:hypothetical protein B0H12DRAFT_1079739 [Mycena haematopus]
MATVTTPVPALRGGPLQVHGCSADENSIEVASATGGRDVAGAASTAATAATTTTAITAITTSTAIAAAASARSSPTIAAASPAPRLLLPRRHRNFPSCFLASSPAVAATSPPAPSPTLPLSQQPPDLLQRRIIVTRPRVNVPKPPRGTPQGRGRQGGRARVPAVAPLTGAAARVESARIRAEEQLMRKTRTEMLRVSKAADEKAAAATENEKRAAALKRNPAGDGTPVVRLVKQTRGEFGTSEVARQKDPNTAQQEQDAELLSRWGNARPENRRLGRNLSPSGSKYGGKIDVGRAGEDARASTVGRMWNGAQGKEQLEDAVVFGIDVKYVQTSLRSPKSLYGKTLNNTAGRVEGERYKNCSVSEKAGGHSHALEGGQPASAWVEPRDQLSNTPEGRISGVMHQVERLGCIELGLSREMLDVSECHIGLREEKKKKGFKTY